MHPVILKEPEVVVGMTVALCLEGDTEPAKDEHGLLLLKALIGGVPARKKFYPVPRGTHICGSHQTSDGREVPMAIMSSSMEGFRTDARFIPVETFTAKDVPAMKSYAVFVDNVHLVYPKSLLRVYLWKYPDGRLLSSPYGPSEWSRREFPLQKQPY